MRVVYIFGKVFSVVGFIVVVVKDEELLEFVIEVGVLMLVDNVRFFNKIYIFRNIKVELKMCGYLKVNLRREGMKINGI